MSIDPSKEDIFVLSESPKRLRKSSRMVRLYITQGVKNVMTGEIVKLESIRLPGGLGTSMEAWFRFIERLNG